VFEENHYRGSKPPEARYIYITHTSAHTHQCVIDVLMADEEQLTRGVWPLVYVTCNGFTCNWGQRFYFPNQSVL